MILIQLLGLIMLVGAVVFIFWVVTYEPETQDPREECIWFCLLLLGLAFALAFIYIGGMLLVS